VRHHSSVCGCGAICKLVGEQKQKELYKKYEKTASEFDIFVYEYIPRVLKVCVITKMLSIPMPSKMKGMTVWAAE
jgi:hypothetical protein